MSGISRQRRAQAQRGQERAVKSRPRCPSCGKKNASRRLTDRHDANIRFRVCYSCGHEWGTAYGEPFGR